MKNKTKDFMLKIASIMTLWTIYFFLLVLMDKYISSKHAYFLFGFFIYPILNFLYKKIFSIRFFKDPIVNVLIGIDPANGDNKGAICYRVGGKIIKIKTF